MGEPSAALGGGCGPALPAAVLLEWAVGVGKALGLLLWLGTGIRALCRTGFIPCEGALRISGGGAPWEVAEDALCTGCDGFVLTFKQNWSHTEVTRQPLPSAHAGTRRCLESESGVGKVPTPFNFQLNPN